PAVVDDPGDQVEAQLAWIRLAFGYRLNRERRKEEEAGPGMYRRIRGNRRSADFVVLQGLRDIHRFVAGVVSGAHRRNEDVAGREVLEVLRDGEEVGIAGRHPGAAPALGVSDRALLAQLVPDRERVLDVIASEDIVIARPVPYLLGRSVAIRFGRGCFLLLLEGHRRSSFGCKRNLSLRSRSVNILI